MNTFTAGFITAFLFCFLITYLHYRRMRKMVEILGAQYQADITCVDKRCAQLVRANISLARRAAQLENAVATVQNDLARGMPPEAVRAKLVNSIC